MNSIVRYKVNVCFRDYFCDVGVLYLHVHGVLRPSDPTFSLLRWSGSHLFKFYERGNPYLTVIRDGYFCYHLKVLKKRMLDSPTVTG